MRLFGESLPFSEKVQLAVAFAIRISIVLAIISGILNGKWLIVFISSLTLFLTFVPAMVQKNLRFNLPLEMELTVVIFIYAGIFLGEVHDFYIRFWWWDTLLHTIAGVVLGFAGFMFLYILYRQNRLKADPSIIAFFAFCFALSMGLLWEIFEFLVDSIFGADMQKSRGLEGDTRLGLMDTMWDLIADSIGALFSSVSGYIYLKYDGKGFFFDRLIKSFVNKNPHLFKEKTKGKK